MMLKSANHLNPKCGVPNDWQSPLRLEFRTVSIICRRDHLEQTYEKDWRTTSYL